VNLLPTTVKPDIEDLTPSVRHLLAVFDVPRERTVSATIEGILETAVERFAELADPIAITCNVDRDLFTEIYAGEGKNDEPAPLPGIIANANAFYLFTGTLGSKPEEETAKIMASGEYLMATALDACASLAADYLVDYLQRTLEQELDDPHSRVLGYSPGYCGWHVSGQRALFKVLKPEGIGITLNDSAMMTPRKSVSGVLVEAPLEAHLFLPEFSFCRECTTHSCVSRQQILKLSSSRGAP